MKNKTKNNLYRRKKLRRIILWGFLIFAGLFISGVIGLKYFLPEGKIKAIVSEKLTAALDRPIKIETLSIDPFGKIDIQGVKIGFRKEEGIEKGDYFSLEKLSVRFRLLSLFRREINITDVVISKPWFHLVSIVSPGEKSKKKKEKKEIEKIQWKTETVKRPLPLSFGLFRLVLKDFRFAVTTGETNTRKTLILDGVNLEVSRLYFPRNYLKEKGMIRGKIRLFTKDGKILLKDHDTIYQWKTDLNFAGEWDKKAKWNLGGNLTVGAGGSEIRFDTQVRGVGFDRIVLDKIDLSLSPQKILHIAGRVGHPGENADIDITAGGDVLDLAEVNEDLQKLLPPVLFEPLKDVEINGSLSLLRGRIKGNLQQIDFRLSSMLEKGKVEFQTKGMRLQGGNFTLQTEGSWTKEGLEKGEISGNLNVESFRYERDSTFSAPVERISLSLNSKIDKAFIPFQGSLKGRVGKALGGSLGLDFHWAGENGQPKNMIVSGTIRADSLTLGSLQDSAKVKGRVNIVADVEMNGQENIRICVAGFSPGIFYHTGKSIEAFPPIRLASNINGHVGQHFKEFVLDSANMNLNELFKMQFRGKFVKPEQRFSFSLGGRIDNRKIYRFLPGGFKKQMEGANFGGEETLSAVVTGKGMGDSADVSINGKFGLKNVSLEIPVQSFSIEEVAGEVKFSGSLKKVTGDAKVSLGKITAGEMRSQPVTGDISFNWEMVAGDSFSVNNGKIGLDSLGVKGDFFFGIGNMSKSPRMAGRVGINFVSKDTVKIINGMSALGSLNCWLGLRTIDPERQWMKMAGEVKIDSLDFVKKGLFRFHRIEAVIPLQVDFNLAGKKFLPPPENYHPFSWIEYEKYRSVYKNSFPLIGNFRVKNIEIAGYRMYDFLMDIDAEKGYVQIPWFNVNVLGGNTGGYLLLKLGSGAKKDISYEIRAQISRINSAGLVSAKAGDEEETELDATLAFKGKGIDFDQGIDLDGSFHISKIGPKFASTLLNGIDPKGSDRSIRLTRRLLNAGWKPKLLSFELRHGYVYPSLVLSQPWFSPIRIPSRLEYGRLPLAFFLKKKGNK